MYKQQNVCYSNLPRFARNLKSISCSHFREIREGISQIFMIIPLSLQPDVVDI